MLKKRICLSLFQGVTLFESDRRRRGNRCSGCRSDAPNAQRRLRSPDQGANVRHRTADPPRGGIPSATVSFVTMCRSNCQAANSGLERSTPNENHERPLAGSSCLRHGLGKDLVRVGLPVQLLHRLADEPADELQLILQVASRHGHAEAQDNWPASVNRTGLRLCRDLTCSFHGPTTHASSSSRG